MTTLDCDPRSPPACYTPVHVGLFFDGTNNNMARDRDGVRVGAPSRALAPDACSHSNIVRLYDTYPDKAQGYFPHYIPGVGTPFPEIGEMTESMEGKAFAKGGQPRILWGLLEVFNAVHRTLMDDFPLLVRDEMKSRIDDFERRIGQRQDPDQPALTRRDWFEPLLARLAQVLAAKPRPSIPLLSLSVFGFSRGAAEARALCRWFDELLEAGRFAGIPAEIRFLGLFDTVASVGGAASVARTTPMPGFVFNGHWAWARVILEPLPGCVKKAVHYIAAHELRMNFPLTRLIGVNVEEVIYPGVHSDVGGGYGPGEQGRGRGIQGALLSQIPLLHMYKAALLAGVPLKPWETLDEAVKHDLEVNADLARAYESYMAYAQLEGLDFHGQIRRHIELYYRWRAMRLGRLPSSESFRAASAQEQQDLREADAMLAGDLQAMRHRADMTFVQADSQERNDVFGPDDMKRVNHWHYWRANNRLPLDAYERWALGLFDDPKPLPQAVAALFDESVHDSFAGFYMAGPVTEYDRREEIRKARAAQQSGREPNRFQKKILAAQDAAAALVKQQGGEPPSEAPEDGQAQGEAAFPLQTDDDAPDLRSAAITTQTYTRREGGGYVVQRGIYPTRGWLFRPAPSQADRLIWADLLTSVEGASLAGTEVASV